MDRFRVVPAAYLLLVRGEGPELEVLLQLRGDATSYRPRHWATAAAGHVEQGESVFVAAAREAREEIGVDVYPAAMRPLTAMQRALPGSEDWQEQRVDYFLTTRVWEGEPAVQEPDKCLELRWCSPARPPEPMVPHEGYLLTLIAAGEVPPIVTFGYAAEPSSPAFATPGRRGGVPAGPGAAREGESAVDDHDEDVRRDQCDDQEHTSVEFDNREANPNSGGPRGLSGDMGVSSERTGPLGADPRGHGIEGTGTVGGALRSTDGEGDTRPTEWDAVDVSRDDLPHQSGHDTEATRESAVTDDTGTWQGIDRTVGEPRPAPIEDEKLRRR